MKDIPATFIFKIFWTMPRWQADFLFLEQTSLFWINAYDLRNIMPAN
jgi:hypothetical protein